MQRDRQARRDVTDCHLVNATHAQRAVFLEDLRAPDAVRAVVDDEAIRALAQTIPPPDAPRGESVT